MLTRTMRIQAVFPPGDPDVVTVLRLVGAANDLSMLIRLLHSVRVDEERSPYGKTIALGARHYVLRMSTLHLPDVKKLINHQDFDRAISRLARHVPQLTERATTLKESLNREPLSKLVADVRNEFAGHPDPVALDRTLARVDNSVLMDVPMGETGARGLHFNVTDKLFDLHLLEESYERYKSNPKYGSATAEDSFKMAVAAPGVLPRNAGRELRRRDRGQYRGRMDTEDGAFVREGIANLHDVFLNASVLRNRMRAAPVEHDPQDLFWFLVTDRFRLERLWIMELHVLVESWQSRLMAPVRKALASALDGPVRELEAVLAQRARDNTLRGMRDVRDYMVHRDRKRYWDLGRTAQIGGGGEHESIHLAFSGMLLQAVDWAKENLPRPDPPVPVLVTRSR
jgi:hypothetical protein